MLYWTDGPWTEGLRLVGTTAGPAAGTQLLDFRMHGGGVLPPSAINVGDRVAVAIAPGGGDSVDEGEGEGVAGMVSYDEDDDVDDDDTSSVKLSTSAPRRRSYEVEGVVRVLDAAAGEVTLVVDPLHQRRLQSHLTELPVNFGEGGGGGDGGEYSMAQAADVVLAGRTLRLVRVPDAAGGGV